MESFGQAAHAWPGEEGLAMKIHAGLEGEWSAEGRVNSGLSVGGGVPPEGRPAPGRLQQADDY